LRTPVLPLLGAALLMSACSGGPGGMSLTWFGGSASAPPPVDQRVAPAAARADDALAAFAASARPGQSGMVDGQPARLLRVYHAASGRECREILLGSGATERTAVACRTAEGDFVPARPLLRGSAR